MELKENHKQQKQKLKKEKNKCNKSIINLI